MTILNSSNYVNYSKMDENTKQNKQKTIFTKTISMFSFSRKKVIRDNLDRISHALDRRYGYRINIKQKGTVF